MYSIGRFAKMIGVTSGTLRNWEKNKKLIPLRTNGNQRRYTKEQYYQIMQMKQNKRINLGYCRVSAKHQKDDLARQVELMELYLTKQGEQYEIITDIGSGINYNKKGLKRVLELVCQNRIATLYILHKDRLVRFGFELIEEVCRLHNTKIHIINQSEENSDEQEMIEDIMNIIHVFSCRMNGRRSHINKKIVDNLTKDSKI
jgi:predicted site-specific integrase-resolvase